MCDIILTNNGQNDRYTYKEDCDDKTGVVDIVFIEQIGEFQKFSVIGTNTEGDSVDEEEEVPNEETVSPSKLFKYIADKLKEHLCPECA